MLAGPLSGPAKLLSDPSVVPSLRQCQVGAPFTSAKIPLSSNSVLSQLLEEPAGRVQIAVPSLALASEQLVALIDSVAGGGPFLL